MDQLPRDEGIDATAGVAGSAATQQSFWALGALLVGILGVCLSLGTCLLAEEHSMVAVLGAYCAPAILWAPISGILGVIGLFQSRSDASAARQRWMSLTAIALSLTAVIALLGFAFWLIGHLDR